MVKRKEGEEFGEWMKRSIEVLQRRVTELEAIEREHKRLNGELREQIRELECMVEGIGR